MAGPGTTRIVAAGAIGNVLEWYDFAVYGYFAAAIGGTFFPITYADESWETSR